MPVQIRVKWVHYSLTPFLLALSCSHTPDGDQVYLYIRTCTVFLVYQITPFPSTIHIHTYDHQSYIALAYTINHDWIPQLFNYGTFPPCSPWFSTRRWHFSPFYLVFLARPMLIWPGWVPCHAHTVGGGDGGLAFTYHPFLSTLIDLQYNLHLYSSLFIPTWFGCFAMMKTNLVPALTYDLGPCVPSLLSSPLLSSLAVAHRLGCV